MEYDVCRPEMLGIYCQDWLAFVLIGTAIVFLFLGWWLKGRF